MESLPNELFGTIAKDITPESLKALHRVSRRVSAGTSDLYYTTFYATRTHAFTPTGIKIISSPSLLARISRIEIMPISLGWVHWACQGQHRQLWRDAFSDRDGDLESVNALRFLISMAAVHRSQLIITLPEFPGHLIVRRMMKNGCSEGIEDFRKLASQVYGVHTAFSRQCHDIRCASIHSNREKRITDFHIALSSISDGRGKGLRLDLGFWEHEYSRLPDWIRRIENFNQVYQFITVLKLPFLWMDLEWLHEPLCCATNLQHLAFKLATKNTSQNYPYRTGGYSLNAVLLQSLTYCAASGAWPKLRQLEIRNPCCPTLIQGLLARYSSTLEYLYFTDVDCIDMNLNQHGRLDMSAWRGLCHHIRSTPRFQTFELDFHRCPPSDHVRTDCRCSWGRTGGSRDRMTNTRKPPSDERLALEEEWMSQAAYAIQRDNQVTGFLQ
jgi:hypothetical protein